MKRKSSTNHIFSPHTILWCLSTFLFAPFNTLIVAPALLAACTRSSMLHRRGGVLLVKVVPPASEAMPSSNTRHRRQRQFTFTNTNGQNLDPYSAQQCDTATESVSEEFGAQGPFGRVQHGGRGVARRLSQRETYRAAVEQQREEEQASGVPGRLLTPIPSHYFSSSQARSSNMLNGIDSHGYEERRPSRADRQQAFRDTLLRNAASVVDFTAGGEADIDTAGLTESEFHSKEDQTTIPQESSLFNSVIAKNEMDSRRSNNSWSVLRKRMDATASKSSSGKTLLFQSSRDAAAAELEGKKPHDSVALQRYRADGSAYQTLFEDSGQTLEPTLDNVGQPRSTYSMRKLYVDGLTGYEEMITKREELQMCEELLRVLQTPTATYIAEEARYCVNLYEQQLGIPGHDALAFSLEQTCPTLHSILQRFFHLGLIPIPPNVCQISEFVGNFSGYPVHLKNPAIGSYCGILNLVSTTVYHLQHVDCPWFPRVHMNPRSLFVVEQPCLSEYKMGYKRTHEPFHSFEYATRVSKDYRIEVLFASVEVQQLKLLREATAMTDYAAKAHEATPLLPNSSDTPRGNGEKRPQEEQADAAAASVDEWLSVLQSRVRESSERNTGAEASFPSSTSSHLFSNASQLKEDMVRKGYLGIRAKQMEVDRDVDASPRSTLQQQQGGNNTARSRIEALKARHAFMKELQNDNVPRKQPQEGDGVSIQRGIGRPPPKTL